MDSQLPKLVTLPQNISRQLTGWAGAGLGGGGTQSSLLRVVRRGTGPSRQLLLRPGASGTEREVGQARVWSDFSRSTLTGSGLGGTEVKRGRFLIAQQELHSLSHPGLQPAPVLLIPGRTQECGALLLWAAAEPTGLSRAREQVGDVPLARRGARSQDGRKRAGAEPTCRLSETGWRVQCPS